jgi:hypothetical protein
VGIWLGHQSCTPPPRCSRLVPNWLQWGEAERVLGYWIGRGISEDKAWSQVEAKVAQRLSAWGGRRSLTPIGRSLALKVMIMSCVWFLAFNFSITTARTKRLRTMFWNFIWGGEGKQHGDPPLRSKGGAVSRSAALASYADGGLQVIDLVDQLKAMRVKWVKLLLTPSHTAKWKPVILRRLYIAVEPWYSSPQLVICELNLNTPQIQKRMPPMWREAIKVFQQLKPCRVAPPNYTSILETPLFGHPEMGLTIHSRWREWVDAGVLNIGDIWDDELGRWLPLDKLCPHLTLKAYHTIIDSIPTEWRELLEESTEDPDVSINPPLSTFVDEWGWTLRAGRQTSLGASTTRKSRASLVKTLPSRGPAKWAGSYPLIPTGNWHRAWTQLHRLVAPANVRYFLWLVMHGALRVGEHSMIRSYCAALGTSNSCTHCGEAETITHALFTCTLAASVWGLLQPLLRSLLPLSWVRDNIREWVLLGGFGSAGVYGNNHTSLYPTRVDAIRTTIPWIIWKARCRSVFDEEKASPVTVAHSCLEYLALHINLHYRRAQESNTVEYFERVWCSSNPPLVDVDDGICYLATALDHRRNVFQRR